MALLVLTLRASSFASASRELGEMSMIERHERWMAQHGKAYEDAAEKERRFEIFKSNFELIQTFNNGNHKFRLGLNRFADLTNDEFRATHNGFRPKSGAAASTAKRFRYENVTAVPASMDWRAEGAVTPVKDQGQCGESVIVVIFEILSLKFSYFIFLTRNKTRMLLGVLRGSCNGRDH